VSAPVDVLAVLDEVQDWLYRSSESRGDDDRAEAVKQARAAVAELIEANIEFDAAHMAYSAAKTGKPRNDAWARVVAAVDRRHAALARVAGGAA